MLLSRTKKTGYYLMIAAEGLRQFFRRRSAFVILLLAWGTTGLARETDGTTDDESTPTEASSDAANDEKKGSFLVVPIIITEPAIGEGIGAAVAWFHGDDKGTRPKVATPNSISSQDKEPKPPPTVTGVFAAYTNNDTQAVGIGHSRSMQDDHYRLTAALADARVNATYYQGDLPVGFSIEGGLLYGNLRRRVGDSKIFLGVSTSFVNADADFRIDLSAPGAQSLVDFSFTDVGVAGLAVYDGRDDTMMPTEGRLLDFTAWKYDKALGGDFDYWTARIKYNSFHRLSDNVVFGARFEVGHAGGNTPFYAEPYVPLRGIAALRYQGETAGVVELEARYRFAKRWAALAFAGAGFVDSGQAVTDTGDDILAGGIGFRFQALRRQNVWLGIDVAQGPEETAWYVQVGHPW